MPSAYVVQEWPIYEDLLDDVCRAPGAHESALECLQRVTNGVYQLHKVVIGPRVRGVLVTAQVQRNDGRSLHAVHIAGEEHPTWIREARDYLGEYAQIFQCDRVTTTGSATLASILQNIGFRVESVNMQLPLYSGDGT